MTDDDFEDHAFLAAFANTSRRLADPAEAARQASEMARGAIDLRVARKKAVDVAAAEEKPAPKKRGRPPKIRNSPPTIALAAKKE